VDALRRDIATQKEHHRDRDLKAEFRASLRKYPIDCDEQYVWE